MASSPDAASMRPRNLVEFFSGNCGIFSNQKELINNVSKATGSCKGSVKKVAVEKSSTQVYQLRCVLLSFELLPQ